MKDTPNPRGRRLARWLFAAFGAFAAIAGCVQLQEFAAPEAPRVGGDWRELLVELRSFERRIGFKETNNFAAFSTERTAYPFCGQAPNRRLPYSYQDPLIQWLDSVNEAKCRDVPADTDVYFGEVEAWGEIGTPVTASMVAGTLDRFVYLVIHEDCHDQFELPMGIEEPLCDIITHRAMAQFSSQQFRWYAVENRAIKNYARMESRHVHATIRYYGELETLYRRHELDEFGHDAMLQARARIFSRAERSLELPPGQLNNISFANYMTYSRHYPVLERAINRLGTNLDEALELFRRVDKLKPSPEDVMQRERITERKSAAFARAYEVAVLGTVEHVLDQRTSIPTSGP